MEQEVLKLAASQGLWAVLFVALLFWVLRENAKREANYQHVLTELTGKLGLLEGVKEDVGDVKRDTVEIKSGVQRLKEKLLG